MNERELIFISYSRRDSATLAERFRADLTANGFNAWLDTGHLTGGVVWSIEIEHEMKKRHVTLALLSPGSYESEIYRRNALGNDIVDRVSSGGIIEAD